MTVESYLPGTPRGAPSRLVRATVRGVAVLIVGALIVLGVWGPHDARRPAAPLTWSQAIEVLPPCPTEDSTMCVWDALDRSNGRGSSFYEYRGVTYYVDAGWNVVRSEVTPS